MTFDTNALIVVVAVLAGLVLAFLVLRSRRTRVRIEPGTGGGRQPYVASSDRPYVKARGGDGPQGNSIADEIATAATDVAGEVLGVAADSELGAADDLTLLKGVGPKFAAQLNALGIHRYAQIAGFSDTEAAHLDERLGAFRGRLARDRVIEQAAYLARGDVDGFEQRFGRLGG